MSAAEDQSQGPVIRDRRRIDPVTGMPKPAAGPADPAAQPDPTVQADPAAQAGPGGQPGRPDQSGRPDGPSGPPGDTARAGAQPRPGKHAVSKPGTPSAKPAGAQPGGEAGPTGGTGKAGDGPAEVEQPARPAPEPGADLAVALAERTADVQRIQAEYANYRKRVERDRAAVRDYALASVIAELLPVLDDIGRAREHGELTGGFKSVAESFEAAVSKLGLVSFGDAGEPFDPKIHEALMHSYSADVTEPTCVQVLLPGYRVGDRILRPARVAVAEPTDPAGARPETNAEAEPEESGEPSADAGDAGDAGGPGE